MSDITGVIGDSQTERVSLEVPTPRKESRVFVGAPDYRVFCWGIDISADVYGLQVSMQMDDQCSTAQIHIVNDNEKWIVPTALGLINYDFIPDELSVGNNDEHLFTQNAPGTNTQHRTRQRVTPVRFAKLKKRNFRQSLFQTENPSQNIGKTANALIKTFRHSKNFPFIPGAPLIQMGDPVRIFFKNPWNIQAKQQPLPEGEFGPPDQIEEWYFGFTGYVASVTEDFDAQSNRSILHLFCEDIRRLLRYMRTTTSPNVFNINVADDFVGGVKPANLKDALNKLSGDSILISGSQAFQAGMKLVNTSQDQSGDPGILDLLLFGDTGNLPSGFLVGQNAQPGMPLVSGLLGFNPGDKTVTLIKGTVGGSEVEAQTSALLDEIYPTLSEEDVDTFGADWSLGALPSVAPEANHFYVILPDKAAFSSEGTDASSSFVWPFDWGMRITHYAEFSSRLEVINLFVKNMDCIWYATPKGDIVLEFPQYDMIPQLHSTPWKSILQIQNEFTKFSKTEDDRNIKTFTIAQGSAIPGINTQGAPYLALARKFNPELAARYGVREQRDSRPFKYSEDYVNSSLKSLAAMWQEMANSDAYRLEGLETLPNFRGCIGRPYFFKFRNLIGFCVGIHHQVVWGELAQTVYEMQYLRHFDPEKASWQKISGEYGWYWSRNPNPIRDDLGSGARQLTTAAAGPVDYAAQDPSGDLLRDVVKDIRLKESISKTELLSEDDKNELDSIADRLSQPIPPDSTERQDLHDRIDQIMSRVRA